MQYVQAENSLAFVSSNTVNLVSCRRYAANQHAALSVSQSVVDVRHRLSLQEDCFVLFVEAAVSLFALALQVCLMWY